MAIKQGCVDISPCGGHGQDLVVAPTKRSEVLASIIVSSQQPFPVRWIASDGWQLNLALVAAVAEHWLSHRAACLFTQEMHCSTKAADVSHEADGEALCPDVCELLQLAMLKDFLFKAIKLLSAQMVQRGCSRSVLSALFCSCLSRLRRSAAAALSCLCCSASAALCSAAIVAAATTAAAASAAAAARLAAYKAVEWLGRTALHLDSLAARAGQHLDAGESCCWPAALLLFSVLAAEL